MAKALVVAAAQSGSGKTSITMGLIRALRMRGLKVAAAKAGPDYIDPRFHEAASGHPCVNLDLWAMGDDMCGRLLARQAEGQDVVVIEGVMGLFDGPSGARGSTADLAQAFGLPVVIVLDASHLAQTAGAIVQGLASYRSQVQVAGVILNRVKSDRHADILMQGLAGGPVPVLGMVRQSDSVAIRSRHLGLTQAEEIQSLEQIIASLASAVARETNLDKLIAIATPIANQSLAAPSLAPLGQRIAIARDAAFSFCYPHVVDDWRRAGAAISFFSPLGDEPPAPDSDAVYLPGGYPELHAGRIAASSRTMAALRAMPAALIYGECGGYMVLGEHLIDADGVLHRMAGLLPHSTSFADRKLHLGYRQLEAMDGPWTGRLRGHEFHYSIQVSDGGEPLFRAADAAGQDLGFMGSRVGRVMGSYAHVIAAAP